MASVLAVFGNMFRDSNSVLMALLVFLAAGMLAFSVMAVLRVRGAVKRRHARITDDESRAKPGRALRHSSIQAVTRLLERTTRHYSETNDDNMKVLRRRLVQAGIYEPRAVALFFISRTVLAVALAAMVFVVVPIVRPTGS